MLNFSNLNDVEFEYLCKDVMSKMLGIPLQRFGAGRDGGVDLTEDAYRKKVIVQVKHYVKTDIAGLLTSLKKEIEKVKTNHPETYYICCSKELTPQNKREIYAMFSDYMESTANIITLIELNDFLEKSENADILHKHFKLWIESTNILTDIFTNDICIDCEALLCDIEEAVHMFVETSAYREAIACLEKRNVLLIVGNPGVGKTITSKMLVLYYAALEYRVRFTTDGADLAALKKALSQSPDTKEVILLDDCFGQAYFSMKETQENELLALIKYVRMNPNKLLIMNSRVTIYQEAMQRTSNLVKSLDKKEYKAFVLDMTNISAIEKAKIFYNHLYFYGVPQAYCDAVKAGKKYLEIVNHGNYNPRIIEFVTNRRQYEQVAPSDYSDFIIRCLSNPEQIWKNEYERRLENTDRILLNTLYSLTNTIIPLGVVEKCYVHRLSTMPGVDVSINHFEQSLKRLQNSMIKVMDVNNKKMLSVANPSVNDFLSAHLRANQAETDAIVSAGICVRQWKRLLSEDEYEKKLQCIFADKSVLKCVFESETQEIGFITYYCIENNIFDEDYKMYLESYTLSPFAVDVFEERKRPIPLMYMKLFRKDICSFYGLDKLVCDTLNFMRILEKLDLQEAVKFIKQINYLYHGIQRKAFVEVSKVYMEDEIVGCYSDVQADEYDIDIGSVAQEYMYEDEHGGHINVDAVVDAVESKVRDLVFEEIYDVISELPEDIVIDQDFLDQLSVDVSGSSSVVEAYLSADYADYCYEEYRERGWYNSEIEYIFER